MDGKGTCPATQRVSVVSNSPSCSRHFTVRGWFFAVSIAGFVDPEIMGATVFARLCNLLVSYSLWSRRNGSGRGSAHSQLQLFLPYILLLSKRALLWRGESRNCNFIHGYVKRLHHATLKLSFTCPLALSGIFLKNAYFFHRYLPYIYLWYAFTIRKSRKQFNQTPSQIPTLEIPDVCMCMYTIYTHWEL